MAAEEKASEKESYYDSTVNASVNNNVTVNIDHPNLKLSVPPTNWNNMAAAASTTLNSRY